jgi:peptidylprolyl isomerase
MKKSLVMHATLAGIIITLSGCGSCCSDHSTHDIKDTSTMPKNTNDNEIRSCSCPHDHAAEQKIEQKTETKAVDSKVTNPSGLEYIILKEAPADAPSPKKGQSVTVHYTGWLDKDGVRGAKFDSSVDRGAPFTFTIGVHQVIQGWDEGVMSMKVGEKRLLTIPPHLGYGSRGAGGAIPGNATLQFEVELLGVK